MTTKNEHLSAVFDDEAGDFEQRRLVDELTKDGELQQAWSRYALVGDVLREPARAEVVMPDFLSGIQQQLGAEEEYSQVKAKFKKDKPVWARPAAGFAMAATIAAVSVFSVQSFMNTNGGTESLSAFEQVTQAPQSEAPQAKSKIRLASNASTSRNVVDMEQRVKMQRYLASHIKNASRRTIAPTMRVISYNYQ